MEKAADLFEGVGLRRRPDADDVPAIGAGDKHRRGVEVGVAGVRHFIGKGLGGIAQEGRAGFGNLFDVALGEGFAEPPAELVQGVIVGRLERHANDEGPQMRARIFEGGHQKEVGAHEARICGKSPLRAGKDNAERGGVGRARIGDPRQGNQSEKNGKQSDVGAAHKPGASVGRALR